MLQALLGAAFFLFAGYVASLAFFRDADGVERVAYSLFLAFTVPAFVLVALNLFAGVKLDAFVVYAVLFVFSVACLAYSKTREAKMHKRA
ncbi:MAG: hypothetical protein WC607_01425 [Candidatus Micrarchaeia archaeon]